MSVKSARMAVGVAVATLLLAACGVRGGLEHPDDPFAGGVSPTATAESAQGKPEGAAPKPHQPSILDALIR